MLVYYSILGMLVFLGGLKVVGSKYEKSENILVFAAVIILFVFAALRSVAVGADTGQYMSFFEKISKTSFDKLFINFQNRYMGDIEVGYKIYNKILSLFLKNYQIITIGNSLLQIGLISIVIFRDSNNKWLSIFLYFTFCFFQTALNLTPSSFVSYFIFLAFPFIEDRKLIYFLMFIAIGMLFHTSAIFFLPLYFLCKIKLTPKRIILIISLGICATIFYSLLLPVLEIILPAKYISYISGENEHKQLFVELLVYAVQLIAIALVFLLLKKDERKNFIENNNMICWIFLFETILYFFSTRSAIFSRGAFLFSPYTIIIIPQLLDQIKDNNKKQIGTFFIAIYGIIVYIARVNVNNVGTTMPYEFFFNSKFKFYDFI